MVKLDNLFPELGPDESPVEETGDQFSRTRAGGKGNGEADQGPGAGGLAKEFVGHHVGGIAPSLSAASRAVDPPDFGIEETKSVQTPGKISPTPKPR